jgi:hypothetical protein
MWWRRHPWLWYWPKKKRVFIEYIGILDDEKCAPAGAATNFFDSLYNSFFVIPTSLFHWQVNKSQSVVKRDDWNPRRLGLHPGRILHLVYSVTDELRFWVCLSITFIIKPKVTVVLEAIMHISSCSTTFVKGEEFLPFYQQRPMMFQSPLRWITLNETSFAYEIVPPMVFRDIFGGMIGAYRGGGRWTIVKTPCPRFVPDCL